MTRKRAQAASDSTWLNRDASQHSVTMCRDVLQEEKTQQQLHVGRHIIDLAAKARGKGRFASKEAPGTGVLANVQGQQPRMTFSEAATPDSKAVQYSSELSQGTIHPVPCQTLRFLPIPR